MICAMGAKREKHVGIKEQAKEGNIIVVRVVITDLLKKWLNRLNKEHVAEQFSGNGIVTDHL